MVAVPPKDLPEVTHGINGIEHLAAAQIGTGFGERRHKRRVVGASQHHHGETVREGCQVMPVLVRRAAAGNEMDLVEMEAALRCSGDGEVADVDRVERSAEQSNLAAPPVRLRGDSVRLRRAQRSSVKGVA